MWHRPTTKRSDRCKIGWTAKNSRLKLKLRQASNSGSIQNHLDSGSRESLICRTDGQRFWNTKANIFRIIRSHWCSLLRNVVLLCYCYLMFCCLKFIKFTNKLSIFKLRECAHSIPRMRKPPGPIFSQFCLQNYDVQFLHPRVVVHDIPSWFGIKLIAASCSPYAKTPGYRFSANFAFKITIFNFCIPGWSFMDAFFRFGNARNRFPA